MGRPWLVGRSLSDGGTRRLEGSDGSVNIVDWQATNSRVARGLLHEVVRLPGVGRIRTWSETLPDEFRSFLATEGFEPKSESGFLGQSRPTVLVTPVAVDAGEPAFQLEGLSLRDRNNWDLRMIDSDKY